MRQGASQGEVVAEFDLPSDHPAVRVLEEAGLPVDDTLILRRVNSQDGRKTAYVNDRRCSGDVLRQLCKSPATDAFLSPGDLRISFSSIPKCLSDLANSG